MSKDYSLEEQHRYIDNDFKNRVVVPCGSIPNTTYEDANNWWDNQIPIWNAWAKRYEKSAGKVYAYHIWNEYIKPIESVYVRLLREKRRNEQ